MSAGGRTAGAEKTPALAFFQRSASPREAFFFGSPSRSASSSRSASPANCLARTKRFALEEQTPSGARVRRAPPTRKTRFPFFHSLRTKRFLQPKRFPRLDWFSDWLPRPKRFPLKERQKPTMPSGAQAPRAPQPLPSAKPVEKEALQHLGSKKQKTSKNGGEKSGISRK